MKPIRFWQPLVLSLALVVLLDRFTKWVALGSLEVGSSVAFVPGFVYFTLVKNTGAAFSILSGKNQFLIFLSIIVIFFILHTSFSLPASLLTRSAVGLILGGAISNLADRFLFGSIVDFIDLRFWPIFNIADSAISIGVVLLAAYYLNEYFAKRKSVSKKKKAKK